MLQLILTINNYEPALSTKKSINWFINIKILEYKFCYLKEEANLSSFEDRPKCMVLQFFNAPKNIWDRLYLGPSAFDKFFQKIFQKI